MSNPLVATAPDTPGFSNFSTEDNKWAEGAGIFSDAANTFTDAASGDWGALALDAVGDGLDALGLITDPFGVLLSAPIGWIIEHIGFLKETLDQVAGDPDDVRAKAQTWTNIAAALDKSAADYEASAKALSHKFSGAAADAYTKAALNYTKTVKGASSHAKEASKAFEVAGAIVGTVRGAIRDLFSQFAADCLWKGLVALANSAWTFGASIAAWTVSTVTEAISAMERASAKILKAVREVTELAGGAGRSTERLKRAEDALRKGPANRAAAAAKHDSAARDLRDAGQRADYETTRVQAAHEAQARAQQHINEATTPAQREAAENELRNAQLRGERHADNLRESYRDGDAARAERAEARQDSRDALGHELEGKAKYAEKGVDYGKKAADTEEDARDNVNDDDRDKNADKTVGTVDNGSLVDSDG